jgi:lysophospholipase
MPYSLSAMTTSDGLSLAIHAWVPQDAKAAVLIVHGIGEHAFRYDHVARRLEAEGYAVYAPDHRGHGRSEGTRTYFETFQQPVADLRMLHGMVEKAHRGARIFMYGHSMGSGISLLYALEYQPDLAGLIVSGTVTNVEDGQPPWLLAAGRLAGAILPKARLVPPIPSSELSTDAAECARYDSDPLVSHEQLRLGMAAGIIRMGREIRQRARMITLPIMFLHGEADKITPVSGSTTMFGLVSSPDKTLHTYPGKRHELVNETNRDEVIQTIVDWLNKH